MGKHKKSLDDNLIAKNKKAHFEYHVEETFEAGLVLEGWEVKSLRAGKINLSDSHVIIKNQEAYWLGAQIQPLKTVSTHINADPIRTRKLLLHQKELSHLIGGVERKGYTIIPIALIWKKNRAKLKIALARGKKLHDKRQDIKSRDWAREKARVLKQTR